MREYDLKLGKEYSISRHRYRELKEFCLQYEEKKSELQQIYMIKRIVLTKNPNNSNDLEIVDTDGTIVHKMTYLNGQRKGTAFAWIGYNEVGKEIWRTTFAPTPGEPNNFQEFKTCETGKVLNETNYKH